MGSVGPGGQTSGEICAERFLKENYSGVHCAPMWDTIHCWPPTPANHVVTASCALILDALNLDVESNNPEVTAARAYRVCNGKGHWLWGNWTNYTECEAILETFSRIANDHAAASVVSYVSFAGSIVSLATLTVALFIFCYFRSLQCGRLSVHKNLVASFILRFIFMIVIAEPSVSDRKDNFVSVEWVCKIVVGLHLYSVMANINWMFAEGFYLHSRITVSVFNSDVPFCFFHLVGWALPAIYILIWTVVMEWNNDTFCWIGFSKSPFVWILAGPMALALITNLIFLLNIVRILVTKLRANKTMETTQFRKAVKATAILFPLLGTTNLLFFINPQEDRDLQNAYFIFNAALQSTQGIFVAVLYCFTNADVALAIRKKYWRIMAKKHLGSNGYGDRRVKWSRTSSLAHSLSDMTTSKTTSNNGSGHHRLPPIKERSKNNPKH